MPFQKADASKRLARIGLVGGPGQGKTYSGLALAHYIAESQGLEIAMIDTEHGSGSLYADEMKDGIAWHYDVLELNDFSPVNYVAAIQEAERAGYGVIFVDSLSHAWSGKGGTLEIKDRLQQTDSGWEAWRKVTPMHNNLVESILQSRAHMIVTMRTHVEYVIEPDARGKMTMRKVGTKPIQREGMEYELGVIIEFEDGNIARVTKSRCRQFADSYGQKPGRQFFFPLIQWLQGIAVEPEMRVIQPAASVILADPAQVLAELLNRFGPEAVLQANGGKLPSTLEELNHIGDELESKLANAQEATK